MKKTLKKLLVCILICLMINNFFFSNITLATGEEEEDGFVEWLEGMLGSVVGLLTWPIRMIALACAWAIDGVTQQVAFSQGAVDEAGNIVEGTYYNIEMLTPFDIFFNRIALLDVNFFNILDDGTIISNIRNSIAGWYYVMRMIAASILLCVLIYVGIRMAITTIASDKAAYKKMLVDWICSLALIFLMQYIILFTFSVNEAFINALSGVTDASSLSDAMVNIKKLSTGISVNSIAATIVFCMLTIQTLGLLISYFNRMLKIAFLIIISPLITLTYSIDKMGDGKAQALSTWLKEFIYTVLLQTFHCIIYIAFVGMALSILNPPEFEEGAGFWENAAAASQTLSDEDTLAGVVLAMLCVKFTKDAEKILGKIFDFSSSTSDSSLAVGMAASAMALSKAKGIGKGARSAVNGIKGAKGALGNAMRTTKVEAMALGAMLHGARNADGSRKTFAEAKDDAETKVATEEADKAERKNAQKYGVQTKGDSEEAKKYQEKVNKLTQANKDKGMSDSLAAAKARAQIAKETRADKIRENPKGAMDKAKHLWKYNKVRGTISAVKNVASQSEVLQEIGKLGKMSIAAGVGTFVGSATYGATGNAFNAFSLGAATYKGSQEFMKSSTKTLTNEMSQLFKGAGYDDIASASSGISDIMQDSDKYEKAEDEIKEILKQIDSALSGLNEGERNSLKSKIKNVVNDEITRNPAATNEDIMNKLLGHSQISQQLGLKQGENGKVESTKAGVTDALMGKGDKIGLLDFKRNKVIYDTVKKAGDIGVSPDSFVQSSLDRFENDLLAFGKTSESSDAKDRDKTIAAIGDGTATGEMKNEIKEKDPELYHEAIESEMSSLKKEKDRLEGDLRVEYDSEERTRINAEITEINKKMENLSNEMKRSATEDKTAYEEMAKNLEDRAKKLEDEIKTKEREAKSNIEKANSQIGDEARKLEQKASELEQEASRLETERREVEALLQHNSAQLSRANKMIEKYGQTPEDNS